MIRRYRRPTVQLTSLLDLLFVMIFVSLLQTKNPVVESDSKTEVRKSVVRKTPPIKPVPVKPESVKPDPVKPANVSLNAVFHFYGAGIPTGTFAMNGSFDTKSGALRLGGVSWINRPEGYEMIPLNGRIDPNTGEFRGRIEFIGCEEFTLRRTSKISNSEISVAGKWEGRYVCSQGETSLTLTIQ